MLLIGLLLAYNERVILRHILAAKTLLHQIVIVLESECYCERFFFQLGKRNNIASSVPLNNCPQQLMSELHIILLSDFAESGFNLTNNHFLNASATLGGEFCVVNPRA